MRGFAFFAVIAAAGCAWGWQDQPWTRHTIDKSSEGADGTRILDVNGDGQPDITTGWEEGGRIRVYLHPGKDKVKAEWPAVTVGNVESPEDAVFVDLDNDGSYDVLSACEGKNQTLYFHWAPKDKSRYLDTAAWKTEALPQSKEVMQWMFMLPMQIDGKNGVDFFAAGKNKNAKIGWWESPADAHDLAGWKWHPLRDAGWVMSLIAVDMDSDGDLDVLFSDRYGERRGVYWLENGAQWKEHAVGGFDHEVRFIATGDLDGDGLVDVAAATKENELWMRRLSKDGTQWRTTAIPTPGSAGDPKSVGIGDVNGDGKPDLVFSTEHANGDIRGMMWLEAPSWRPHDISGPPGLKYDLVVLLDMDGDGDLDVLSSEERDQLGVFWYENPGSGQAGPPMDLARRVTRHETASEAERANYLYKQTVSVMEYGERNRPGGEYREVREVIFSPTGERTERLVGNPSNTLKRLQLTPEDFADVRDIQPMMLTEDRMHLYQFTNKGEETMDAGGEQVACWVLQVRPRQILYGMRLFEGQVWVDKRDYAIIRSEGRAVPQIRSNRPGKENLFPYFTTVRQKVGSFWFPVLTEGADTLDFSTGPVRMKLSIRYRDYKKFGAESTIRPAEPEK